ncbi:MAG: hypothetical protein DRI90_26770, partial [Deltaproteobacteria bacterium]
MGAAAAVHRPRGRRLPRSQGRHAGGAVLPAAWILLLTLVSLPGFAQTQPDDGAPSPPDRRAGEERTGLDRARARLLREAPGRLAELEGKPIRSISVETTGSRWPETKPVRSVTLGEPLSAQVARRAIAELLEDGGFAQAYADARPLQDGVVLRLVVVPRRLMASIHIEGGSLTRERTLEAAKLEEGGEITEPLMGEAEERLRSLYLRYGYDDAKIAVTASGTDDPRRVLLTLDITPGERRTISLRIFVIEPKYDRVLGDLKGEYAVERGDHIDEDELLDANNEMAEALREAGFLEAIVKHRILRRGQDVFLYVYLQTGPLSRFFFEGNFRFDDSELTDALEL